uniref:Uncharacterized protein n=1 Tax=Panagrolaimus sp. JU765 TaxID=591449 RepID=A0AC34Q5C9_9BILA
MITQTQIDFNNGVILMMMAGPFRLADNPYAFNLINLWIIALFACVMFLPIPFIFRYFAVCRNYVLSRLKYLMLLFSAFTISFLYTCLHAWAFLPRGNEADFVYIIDHDFWKDSNGKLPVYVASDIKDGRIIVLVTFTMLMGSFSYFLIILFNMLIYRKLATMKTSMSSKTKEVHRQLSNVLKWQALVPFVVCVMPLTFVFVLCAIGTRTAGKGIILTLIVSWIPVMNPLSAIIFVKQYRKLFTQTILVRILCPERANKDMTSSEVKPSFVERTRNILTTVRNGGSSQMLNSHSQSYIQSTQITPSNNLFAENYNSSF